MLITRCAEDACSIPPDEGAKYCRRHMPYQPRGKALDMFYSHERRVFLSGPAGTGKTRACLEKVHAICEKYPMVRTLCIRKVRASLTNTALVTYEQEVLPDLSFAPFHGGDAEYQYPNGSIMGIAGLDNATKIMSSQYDVIYTPEATEFTESDLENLTTRMRNARMPFAQLLGDLNPSAPSHFLNKWRNEGRCVMFETTHKDNPTLWDGENWTKRGAAYMGTLDALTGVRRKRLYLGQWAAAEGAIYDTFDRATHVIPRFEPRVVDGKLQHFIPPEWPRYWVVDFGYTNPFVWQAWAEDPDGTLIQYREIYETGRLVEDLAAKILNVCAAELDHWPRALICDHDAEDRATLERHLGIPTLPAYKSVAPGIQAVQSRLNVRKSGKPGLVFMEGALVSIDPALAEAHKPTSTLDEIESYVWDKRGGRTDQPLKQDDHGMDAKRYLVAFVDDLAVEPHAPAEGLVTYYNPKQISPF